MIIFLYGSDTYRSREKLKMLKDKFIREVDKDGNSLIAISGETATMDKINEKLGAPSLFSRKRMIIIERLFSNKSKAVWEQFYDYLKEQSKKTEADKKTDNIIIIWDDLDKEKLKSIKLFKLLSQEKFAEEFKPLSNTEAINWIKKQAVERGAVLRQNAAVELSALLGNDLWRLSNELDKLIHYKSGSGNSAAGNNEALIEAQDVQSLIKGIIDENIFALTDAISVKNKSLAAKLFEQELESGAADAYLMRMVIRQFKILAQVRQGLDSGLSERKILNQLKLHPFVLRKSLAQVRNFSLPVLKSIIVRLIEIDSQIKTGQTNAATALSLMIAKI